MTNKKSNKIEIITAENCGFCFGVRKAVNMLFDEMKLSGSGDRKNRIYLFGKIIHNNLFIDELTSKGLIIIDDKDIEEIYGQIKLKNYDFLKQKFDFNNNRSVTVVIRAHGIPKIIFDALKELEISENNMKVIDATCECVKRNHKTAAENTSAETFAVIFGDKNHPEIVGLESYVNGEVRIFKDLEKLEENFDSLKQEISKKNYKKLIILAQTTHNIDDYKKSRDFIEKNFNDKNDENCTDADAVFINSMNFFDTICGATQKRQAEAEKLSKICDVMIVVGGQNSSNTKKLYEICKKNCVNSFIVETSERLPLNIFDLGQAVVKVGITAGASTPDSIIEEVKKIMADSTENSKNINEEAIGSENDQHEQSFAELLDLTFATLNRGDRVKGIVSYVSAGEVHVDLNGKYTGVLAFDEVTDDSSVDLKDIFKVGDEIETQIIKINDLDGTALLSKKRIDSNDNWDKIIKSFENGTICEGKIVQVVNGGIIVLIDGVKVFVPASHANVSKDTDLQTLVNNKVKVKIIDVNQQKRRAIASIRNAGADERKANEDKIWSEIEKDKKYAGVVKSIANYGVFVDIGGIDGMVHITELSWNRIKHPSEVLKVGDKIEVYIKDFDTEKRRIALGYKTEEDNPWTKFKDEYKVGDVVDAKIINTMPFGAFAEITPGVDGLIHISQISDKKISKPSEVLNVGDIVQVKITEIVPESKKLSLSMRALIEEPVAPGVYGDVVVDTDGADTGEAENVEEAKESETEEIKE